MTLRVFVSVSKHRRSWSAAVLLPLYDGSLPRVRESFLLATQILLCNEYRSTARLHEKHSHFWLGIHHTLRRLGSTDAARRWQAAHHLFRRPPRRLRDPGGRCCDDVGRQRASCQTRLSYERGHRPLARSRWTVGQTPQSRSRTRRPNSWRYL